MTGPSVEIGATFVSDILPNQEVTIHPEGNHVPDNLDRCFWGPPAIMRVHVQAG